MYRGHPSGHRARTGSIVFSPGEAVIALVIMNVDAWFRRPFSWHQIVSWILLFGSFVPLILGLRLLKRIGKPDARREEEPLLGLEKTTTLVTEGVYGLIRHPMYGSLLLLAWGVFFKRPGWSGGLLALAATAFLTATARIEEGENIRYFGPAYKEYMRNTKMFVPYLF